jgi:DNA-binding transcriptional MerR regulator
MATELLRIGDIARQSEVSVDTVRHYERKGVLGDIVRDASGYRRYPLDTVRRIRIVRRALSIGFTLDELGQFFKERRAGSPPCRRVRALAAQKLSDLDSHIVVLQAVRESLARTLDRWDTTLQSTPEGGFAFLFEDLA